MAAPMSQVPSQVPDGGSQGLPFRTAPAVRGRQARAAGDFLYAGLLALGLLLAAGPAVPQSLTGSDAAHFYQLHPGPAWSGTPAALARATIARSVLLGAAEEGLDPTRYRVAAADDVALTTALLRYMRDVSVGRPEFQSLDADVALPARDFDAPAILAAALRDNTLDEALAALPPHQEDYAVLRTALARTADPARRGIIAANMERWRWLPATLEPDRIMVNAATAQLRMYLAGTPVLTSRVIVGKPRTPTPILRAEGAAVTVNPPWTVPRTIAVTEILPRLKRNPRYLEQEDMVLLDGPPGDPHGVGVNWRAVAAGSFPYQVQQMPGEKNALGRIKLELPNRFDVYLHDTPARALFARRSRSLSHGCIRVEKILPLATYALDDSRAAARIAEALAQPATSHLPLKRRLPVYILYWTALADGPDHVRFAPDIYGRDRRLIAAMQPRPATAAAARATSWPKC